MHENLILLFLIFNALHGTYFSKVCSRKFRINTANGTFYQINYFCCRHFEEKNGICKACPTGYYTQLNGSKCQPCSLGLFGEKCAETCKCRQNEKCDNVDGCVTFSHYKSTGATFPTDVIQKTTKQYHEEGKTTDNVILYMSCIAGIGLFLATVVAMVRNRHAILKCMSKNTKNIKDAKTNAVYNHFEHDCTIETSEIPNVYDVIDENKMLKTL